MTRINPVATQTVIEPQDPISGLLGAKLGLHYGRIRRQLLFWTFMHKNPDASKSRRDFVLKRLCREQIEYAELGRETPWKFKRFARLIHPQMP